MCSMLFMTSDTNFMEGYFTDISWLIIWAFTLQQDKTGVEILKGKKPCKFKNVPTKRTKKTKTKVKVKGWITF